LPFIKSGKLGLKNKKFIESVFWKKICPKLNIITQHKNTLRSMIWFPLLVFVVFVFSGRGKSCTDRKNNKNEYAWTLNKESRISHFYQILGLSFYFINTLPWIWLNLLNNSIFWITDLKPYIPSFVLASPFTINFFSSVYSWLLKHFRIYFFWFTFYYHKPNLLSLTH